MRKKLAGSLGLSSVLFAAVLVGIEPQVAMACSGSASSGSGLTHGSSLGAGSVTVCVGAGGSSAGSSSSQTITKTVKVKVPVSPPIQKPIKPVVKPTPKVVAKPTPKPVAIQPVSCPSSSQLASMPRSADAAERWVESICSSAKPTAIQKTVQQTPKATLKPKPKPKQKYRTMTIVETVETNNPGSSWNSSDRVSFSPNRLLGSVYPSETLRVGQVATFSSNPSAHFGIASVLGRQAQVHFAPAASGWSFSDGTEKSGADVTHSFERSGRFEATAFVYYQVSYRLLGETNWQAVGQLLVQSETVEVLVGTVGIETEDRPRGVLLVGQDCLANPDSFGCQL